MSTKVLLAEDDSPVRSFLTKALQSSGLDVVSTNNGLEAWTEFQKQSFSVILTDLDMPVMRGDELIDKIHAAETKVPPLIIVLTSLNDSQHIIDIMKKGVFDYLIKPAEASQIILKVKHAAKSYDVEKMQYILKSEKELRLSEQLNWIKYKNEITNKDTNTFKDNIVRNMRHNLGQTGGFGNLMALLDIVQDDAKEEGDHFLISREIFNLLKENVTIIDNTFSSLENITHISESNLELEKISAKEVYELTQTIATECEKISQINSHTIVFGDRRDSYSEHFLNFNKESFKRLMNELFLNAFKFSEPNSKIFVLFRIQDRKLFLSLVNDPVHNMGVIGVPLEYSNLVFEPFFRINKFVFEKYQSLDIGLGLTMVKELVKKFNGDVSIMNIKEFTSVDSDNMKVNLEISLPLV